MLPVLQQILEELRLLRAGQPGSLSKADHVYLARLLPVVHTRVAAAFTVRDLIAHAESNPDVALALAPMDDQAVRRLGKLFARAAGVLVEGHRLDRGVQLREGLLWTVSRVS